MREMYRHVPKTGVLWDRFARGTPLRPTVRRWTATLRWEKLILGAAA